MESSEILIGNSPVYNTEAIKYMKNHPNSSILKNYPNLIHGINSIEISTELLNSMTEEYCNELVSSGLTPTRKELKEGSNIIKSKFTDTYLDKEELENINNYVAESWLHMIPCLEEGLIIDNASYYHYYLKELDLNEKKLSFHMRYYTFNPKNKIKFMFLGQYYFDVEFFQLDKSVEFEIHFTYASDPIDIYSYKIDDMDIWDFDHKDFWRNVITKTCFPPKGVKFAQQIVSEFMGQFGYINYMLRKSPVKGNIGRRKSRKTKEVIKEESTSVIQRIKIPRRNEFGLEIISEKKPVEPTEDSVRRYKTAIWRVRGHLSHSKTGKEFWVTEHVARRHDMNSSTYDVPRTIIEE